MSARRTIATAVALMLLMITGAPGWAGGRLHVPAVNTPWPGKILVAHDEYALSDHGFTVAPGARQFALNVGAWLANGRPGRFLVHSSSPGLTGTRLAQTMERAGHDWTVDADAELTLSTLLQYDAVFIGGDEVDNALLIDYVRAGGGVFLVGGTGLGGNVFEAAHWNMFLGAFGLRFDPNYNVARQPGVYAVPANEPLFRGVGSLYEQVGNTITRVSATDPNTRILMSDGRLGLYATYQTSAIPVGVEICPNRLNVKSTGYLSVAIAGTPQLNVWSIDPASVRLLGAAPRGWMLNYNVIGWAGSLIGRTSLGSCGGGRPDRHLDLVVKFDNQDVVREIQRALGRTLADGDTVAVTVTGKLRYEYGGRAIVGEDLVVAQKWWAR
jgi:hypothetical protein